MFEGMSEEEARAYLVKLAGDYCEKYHQRKPYVPGDHINYGGRFYDRDEMEKLVDASLEFWLTETLDDTDRGEGGFGSTGTH